MPFRFVGVAHSYSLKCWLLRFMVKARREDGKVYLPSSISNLLACLYCYSKEWDRDCPNVMNRKDPAFMELTGTLQVTCRELHREGVKPMYSMLCYLISSKECTLRFESKQ